MRQAAAERHRDGLSFILVVGHAGDGDLHGSVVSVEHLSRQAGLMRRRSARVSVQLQ
jgi:hypothetical protein